MPTPIETKDVVVSPKWKLILEDLKDLVSDFLWGAAALGVTSLLDYLNGIDLAAIAGQENAAYAALFVGFLTTFLSRVMKKIKKQSNYDPKVTK